MTYMFLNYKRNTEILNKQLIKQKMITNIFGVYFLVNITENCKLIERSFSVRNSIQEKILVVIINS